MNVRLMRNKKSLYGESDIWDQYSFFDVETDYTGRWKILLMNGISELFIECFELIPVTRTEYSRVEETEHGIFWDKTKVYMKPVQVFDRYKAKVNWVSEHDLELRVIEEYINECGSCE